MTAKKNPRPEVIVTYPERPTRTYLVQEKDGHGDYHHPLARFELTPKWFGSASTYGVLPTLDRPTIARFLTTNLNVPRPRQVVGAARDLSLHVALDEPTADGRVSFTAYVDKSLRQALVRGTAHPSLLNDLLWLLVGL